MTLSKRNRTTPGFLFGLLLILSSCSSGATKPPSPSKEEKVNPENLVLSKRVTVSFDSLRNTHILYGQDSTAAQWTTSFDTIQCVVGYNGIAPPGLKREGDGKTPAGEFPLGLVFGYENDLEIAEDFLDLEPYHYWISDSESSKYNTLVDYNPAPAEAEKMERNDHLYKYGIIIEYNTETVVPGMGSAIFIHIYRSPDRPTAGCVGIAESDIIALIKWLQGSEVTTINIID